MDFYEYCTNSLNLFFGLFFNSIAIYITCLLSFEKHISQMSNILKIQFIIGILTSIITSLIGMVVIFYDDHIIFMLVFLKWIPKNFTIHNIILLIAILMIYGTIVFPVGVLVIRCLILCKNFKVNIVKTIIMVILCFLFASFLVHASSEASKEEIQNKTLNEFMKKFHIKSNLFQNDNVIMGSLATLENWKFIIIDVIFFSTIYFFLIIFSLYKYTRYMKSVASKISETTKRLYLDFLRIITLQACTPFIIAFPSIVIFLITVAIGYSKNIPFLGDVLVKLLCTTPTINSMLFIFLPKKNRKRFVALFRNVITRKDSFLSSDTFNGSNHKSTYEHSTNKRKNNIVPSDVQTLRIQRKVSFIA